MTPENGQRVKVFIRTGMALEGIVEEWSEAQVLLRSLDGDSLMIVHHPADDIVLTKIVFEEEIEEEKPESGPPKPEVVKQKLQEAQSIDDPELQKKSIAELRSMVVEQEKQMIANKVRQHFGSAYNPKMTQYGGQKSIFEKAAAQEASILKNHFGRKK